MELKSPQEMAEAEFPEMQLVGAEEEEKPKPKPKRRFGAVAMKVLADIVVKREMASPIEELNEDDKKSPGPSPRQRRPSSRSSASSQPSLPRAASRMNFASVVRLAKFRRISNMSNGSRGSRNSSRVSSTTIEEEETLPETPRFCATLSPEAQFAMMKGYEDVLIDHLKEQHKTNNLLFRVKTPMQRVSAIQFADLSQLEGRNIRPTTPCHEQKIINLDLNVNGKRRPKSHVPFPEMSQTNVKVRPRTVPECSSIIPKDKQLKLSLRFQSAMDILDSLKKSKGLPVISKKEKLVDNPLASYNSWSQTWSKEFKFRYRMPGAEERTAQ